MFRLQENTPEIYTKSSRDFQVFCRTYDILINAIRYSIKSTDNLLNPLLASDKILPLLASRVGFFPKSSYNTHALRLVISTFPYMMKYKGSKKGIEIALYTILKAEENYGNTLITISDDQEINIYSEKAIINENLLRDVLSYIIPIGYQINIGVYKQADNAPTTQLNIKDYPLYKVDKAKNISFIAKAEDIGNNKDINPMIDDFSTDNDDTLHNAKGSFTVTEVLSFNDVFGGTNNG